jgi:hypothetical protein
MHLEVHEVVQGAVHVHHDPYVPHIQGQIKLIRRLFWLHVEVHEVDQGAVHVHP